MPEQPSTLAARIRAKYPGVYDDLADGDLEQRVAAKFPGVYDDVPRTEATLTRERRAPGSPSALEAGPHPESARTIFGKPGLHDIGPGDLPSDAAFLKRAPDVGLAVGSVVGGPLGGGVGRAAGRLVKNQYDHGPHLPSREDLTGAAMEGAVTTALGAGPRLAQVGARAAGPVLSNHARSISKGIGALSGIGAGVATLNPITGIGTGAAARLLTSPSVIRGAGNLATRVGSSPIVERAADWVGRGARVVGADAFRQALLDALEAEPSASAVP